MSCKWMTRKSSECLWYEHKSLISGISIRWACFRGLPLVLGGAVGRENVGYSIQLIGRRMFVLGALHMDGPQVIIKLIPRSSWGSSCHKHVSPLVSHYSPPSVSFIARYYYHTVSNTASFSNIFTCPGPYPVFRRVASVNLLKRSRFCAFKRTSYRSFIFQHVTTFTNVSKSIVIF